MTVRELINILLMYDADEHIDFYIRNDDSKENELDIIDFSEQSDLPWIDFIERN